MTRVLVVEDDARLARSVARGLLADGFTADVAHDGEEGLWRAQQYAYDVVVLDLMLPASRCAGGCARTGCGPRSWCSRPSVLDRTGQVIARSANLAPRFSRSGSAWSRRVRPGPASEGTKR